MVGWGFAFGRGIVIFLWTIVWGMVAGIVALLVTGGTLLSAFSNPTSVASNPTAFLAAFFLAIFISVFISLIGFYASIVKVTVDGAILQIEKSAMLERPSSMGTQPTLTVAPSLRKYCPNCGTSLPGGTMRCPNCNNSL